jgi:hypothetical protein
MDDDFCENDVSGLCIVSPNEGTGLLSPPTAVVVGGKSQIESSSNEEVISYWGLWQNHSEYRWYLLSSLVTDVGE